MKNYFLFLILAVLLVSGCSFFKQAQSDYQLSKNTPYAEGEVTIEQKTQVLTGTISAIPYANLATPLLALGAPFILSWLRGRRLRYENMPINEKPITGSIGRAVGLEAIVQHLANVAAGLFEVGANGSSLKRGWKVTLLAGLGVALAPEAQHIVSALIPILQNHPPAWLAHLFNGTVLALTVGGLGTLEKWLSSVEPLKAPSFIEKQPV